MLAAAFFPIAILAAAALAVASRRGPFIAHRRVGWRGETLWMLKLRTMWDAAATPQPFRFVERIEEEPGLDLKRDRDPRIGNSLARFVRRHSIDEIPQLWHVVRGDMSLVGPRPLTASELRRHYGADAQQTLQVKPGIAGLWQTSGRARLTFEQRRAFDLRWVRERSLALYVRIVFRAAAEMITGANTW